MQPSAVAIPGLTVLCHPDPARVGEQAALVGLRGDGEALLSRLAPEFRTPDGERRGPLADHRLSRQPWRLTRRPDGGLTLDAGATRTRLTLGGEAFPVLLRGESGTGKELVVQAIQRSGPRREAPYFAVNVAAVPSALAAAELFGAAKGAFSGADRRRPGYFQRADGGTLFLDEIGEMPPEVQVLLLRALESKEVQPVGAEVPQPVDVRVIAATDADLEQAIADGRFKAPLLHRLASYEIVLPPLRERREDVGRLFFHFLRQELAELGESDRLADHGRRRPWVSAELVARLAAYGWPGNVRQLRNVVRQLAVASRGSEVMVVGSRVERMLAEEAGSGPATRPEEVPPALHKTRAAPRKYRDPSEVGDDELTAALRSHQYRLKPAAEALGVSRASLYVLIDACPRIRKASDLGREDIVAAAESCGGRPEAMAEELEVSKQGLKMRMKELGLR